jgi:PII-like signaling protein
MLQYKLIEIFTSEGARWKGRPLSDAIVQYVRDLKVAARTIVTRATQGSYESGEISTARIEVLSYIYPFASR